MASTTGVTDQVESQIVMYGADWCVDCRNAQTVLDASGVAYSHVDLMADETAAARAEQISGSKHIPVIVFPDGVFYVEPTKAEVGLKIRALQAEGRIAQ